MDIATLLEIRARIEAELKLLVKEKVLEMPAENEEIKILGNGCFCTTLSELRKTPQFLLSAEYYDFEQQKNKLLSIIDSSRSIEGVLVKFGEIVETGSLKEGSSKFLFHPEIIAFIKKVLNN